MSCESVVRVVEIEGGVGFQIAVSPIDVFEVFSRDYCDLEMERLWGSHEIFLSWWWFANVRSRFRMRAQREARGKRRI